MKTMPCMNTTVGLTLLLMLVFCRITDYPSRSLHRCCQVDQGEYTCRRDCRQLGACQWFGYTPSYRSAWRNRLLLRQDGSSILSAKPSSAPKSISEVKHNTEFPNPAVQILPIQPPPAITPLPPSAPLTIQVHQTTPYWVNWLIYLGVAFLLILTAILLTMIILTIKVIKL